MKTLVVIGAGGFGRETLDVAAACNDQAPQWNILGVVDDAPSDTQLQRLAKRDVRWLGTLADFLASASPSTSFVVAIGDPSDRARLCVDLAASGRSGATLIHPKATIGSGVSIGEGTVICAGAQISTNVQIGEHVHINPNAVIGHDSEISSFVSINPGAIISGEVRVSTGALVGAGAVVLQGLTLGAATTVGAAACVTRDVGAERVVKGVPAR
ncbi:acetyltransferase [Agrococcus sp. DT81.2]|uniref:acetyltransferase n=1 Tax=Agrococcus sp. DT81.2 TaxID=3393414 RepID=UPI003CE4D707